MYWQSCQTFKMKLFAKVVSCWKPLSIFTKNSIFGVCQGSEYTSVNWEWIKYYGLENENKLENIWSVHMLLRN